MVEERHNSKALLVEKQCKCNSTSHLRTNQCKRKRNTSAVSGHTISCDREETSLTRVTSPSRDEDSSESDREETSLTRGMSPLRNFRSLWFWEWEFLRLWIGQTLNQILKWRSSVSLKQRLYAFVVPLPINGTVPTPPKMLSCKVHPPQGLLTQLQPATSHCWMERPCTQQIE